MDFLRWIWDFRRYLVFGLTPILFSPIPIFIQTQEAYTAYVIIWVALYWCTEVIALPVTGLLPAVLLPLFGVLKAQDVASQYTKDMSLLILAGLIVASAIEETNLHKRVALKMLMWTGSSPKLLMLGLMLTTGIMSMWISNIATTAMMIQIVHALLQQMALENQSEDIKLVPFNSIDESSNANEFVINAEDDEKNYSVLEDTQKLPSSKSHRLINFNKALLLCIPYAANIGGTGTLTGTPINLVGVNVMDSYFGSAPGINYGSWMIYSAPGMFLCLFISWIWLSINYLGCRCCPRYSSCCNTVEGDFSSTQTIIKEQYKALGRMSFAEKVVAGHFLVMLGLWFTREPRFVPGWAVLFKEGYISDATGVLMIAISLFVFPSTLPTWSSNHNGGQSSVWNPILTWEIVIKSVPWGLFLYIGAGFAMAEACKVSGLSAWLGTQLSIFKDVNQALVALLSSTVVAMVTEFTSNMSTATIFLPLLVELAVSIRMNPLYIVLPSTIACSYAFMLPVATPPNAIAFSYGSLRVMDMVKSGAVLNIICVLIANISINTLGVVVFDARTFPEWAETSIAPTNASLLYNVTIA